VDPNPTPDPVPDPGAIPSPLVLVLANGSEFKKIDYLALGYNRFDVMCIGAAGGYGGGYRWYKVDSMGVASRNYHGGAGGGGGVHRIKGRLALLPTVCPVVVGQAGANAPFIARDTAPDPHPDLVVGGDGGYSSFNNLTCRSSGGKGGGIAQQYSISVATPETGIGGEGGIGNSIVPGGGAAPGAEGIWNGSIGKGGGGGHGGHRIHYGNPFDGADEWTYTDGERDATPGGAGSYFSSDSSVSGPGGASERIGIDYVTRSPDPAGGWTYTPRFEEAPIKGGAGGGGSAFPLNGETLQYGSKAPGAIANGLVIIRLTYAIV
jgi:hypothetical protein